jgi:hypothetical protein
LQCFGSVKQFLSLAEAKGFLQDVSFQVPQTSLLTSFLWLFRDRQATDPRDKIYSLLGLFQTTPAPTKDEDGALDLDRSQLIVDYQSPKEEVYASFVKVVMDCTRSLDIICVCQHSTLFERTWVPDWSQPWSRVSLLSRNMTDRDSHNPKFRCSGSRLPSVNFLENLLVVNAAGLIWDSTPFLG